jgi:sugar/nucleoside kinase (ribokinase family)
MEMKVYGIGSPLIDILVDVTEEDIKNLGLDKGVMHLINEQKRHELLEFLDSKKKRYSCGGDCPNTIITLSNLGVSAGFGGRLGSGAFGKIYSDEFKKHNLICDLKNSSDLPTGSSIILITPDHERTMNTYLGNCRNFCVEDLEEENIKKAEYLYFTCYLWDTDCQKQAAKRAIEIAESNNIKIIFDVADPFAVKRYKSDFLRIIKEHAYLVFANKEESKILFDTDNPEIAINKMSELCAVSVVKTGSEGSLVKRYGEDIIKIPIHKVQAVDTTGAGDIYAAGFIYGLVNDFDLRRSGVFASFLASQIVSQKGAQFSEGTQKEILAHLKRGSWEFI